MIVVEEANRDRWDFDCDGLVGLAGGRSEDEGDMTSTRRVALRLGDSRGECNPESEFGEVRRDEPGVPRPRPGRVVV